MDGRPRMRRVIASSLVGTSLEWYDFFLYGSAAALVFDKLFFPNYDPLVGTILAFATFAVGFISRPVGGILFGYFGDKFGRRNVLFITLILMGASTMAIGLLPTYAGIGLVAPACLTALRFLQGLGLGGEWGGAILMPFEHATRHHRGFASSWPQCGGPLGMLLATIVLAVTTALLSPQQFIDWGWRIPFLLSGVVVVVGIWIRLSLPETPAFQEVRTAGNLPKNPLKEVLQHHRPGVLRAMGARVGVDILYYSFALLVLTYVTQHLGMTRDVALNAVIIGSLVEAVLIPAFGALSDRLGRRPVMMVGATVGGVWAFAFFPLLDTKSPVLIILAVTVGLATHAVLYGAQGAYISELFPSSVRYTGASSGYQLAGILGGALAPIIALALMSHFDSSVAVSVYIGIGLTVVVLTVYLSRETAFDDLGSPPPALRRTHPLHSMDQ
jgi:metabolite-proton symporter